uniref:Interferon-related developmental regulator N-terminal domain-containing protein n=1 Tax=Oryza barthii TaxID=65489 RepID=A0A0D3F2I5_9ORYZ
MVLKKSTGRSSGHASTSYDASAGGGAVAVSACGQRIRRNVSVLEKVAVSVHDSRASTREAALAELIAALEGFLSADDAEGPPGRPAWRSAPSHCSPSRSKKIAAVETAANPLGSGANKIMKATYPLASRILEAPQADASLVVAALECLAVVAFVDVAAENMDDTEACMKALWGLIRPSTGPKLLGSDSREVRMAAGEALANMDDTEACMNALWAVICPSAGPKLAGAAKGTASPRVLVAAVSAWTLVLTTTGGWNKKKKVSPAAPWRGAAAHAHLVSLLGSDSREVRMAAGEALAVAIEMKLFTEKNNGALFSKMEARASDLAIDAAGAGVDKTNFVEQKELFKDITRFLAGGKPPVISVRTSSSNYGLLTTSTWTDNVRLNFLRRFLGGGFLHHLQGKGLMGQVFVIDDDEVTGKLSAARSKRSLMKDTRIVKELNGGRGGGGAMDEKKEKKQEMIKNSLEKKRTVKKERLIAYELKHGSSDL